MAALDITGIKRGLRLITIKGQTKCITEWIDYLGLVKKDVEANLYRRGFTIEQALGI